MASDSVVDERTLRELYLTGFEIVVKEAKPKTIMSSYNLINGTYANENRHLLMDILRGEWGFDGAVVTDWGGSNDHALGVQNGSTLEMPAPGGDAVRELMQAVQSGKITEADVDARLDELLTRLDEGYADIAAVQEIRDAMTGMEQTVQELTPRDTYTAAMIEYESLQKLGEAIYDQNMDTVIMILDSMGRRLHEKTGMEQVDALMNLVYDVNGSLAKPLRDNSQEQLRQAMMMFAGGLESAAEMVYNGRDNTQMIDTALETVETYIRDYLGVPEEGERYDPFAHMDYGKGSKPSGAPSPEAANVEKPKSRMETEYVYDPPEALKASGYQPGALNERGERQRLSADTRERPMGAVPYGEVYGRYYAAYLSMIEDETFPQALREAAQAYMNGL